MRRRFRRLGVFLGLAIAAIAIAASVGFLSEPAVHQVTVTERIPPPTPKPQPRYINMEGAAENAYTHAKKWYGLSLAGSLSEPEDDAECPSHVIGRRGQIFWCQVLLEGHLIGVEIELISSLGFFDVVKVAENEALWNQLYEEQVECVVYRESESAANCG